MYTYFKNYRIRIKHILKIFNLSLFSATQRKTMLASKAKSDILRQSNVCDVMILLIHNILLSSLRQIIIIFSTAFSSYYLLATYCLCHYFATRTSLTFRKNIVLKLGFMGHNFCILGWSF